jgi:hypothetical protein
MPSECYFPNELLPDLRNSRSEYNKFVQGKHTASASDLPPPTLASCLTADTNLLGRLGWLMGFEPTTPRVTV